MNAIPRPAIAACNYKLSVDAQDAFVRYITLRKAQPPFSNARSIRNALDRMRLRQANRLVADLDQALTADDIMSLEPRTFLLAGCSRAALEPGRLSIAMAAS
jgi:hypothetical protein